MGQEANWGLNYGGFSQISLRLNKGSYLKAFLE